MRLITPVRKVISPSKRIARMSPEDQAVVAQAVRTIAKQCEENPTVILDHDDPDYTLEPEEIQDIENWRRLVRDHGVN